MNAIRISVINKFHARLGVFYKYFAVTLPDGYKHDFKIKSEARRYARREAKRLKVEIKDETKI